jgi:hypothetical protein
MDGAKAGEAGLAALAVGSAGLGAGSAAAAVPAAANIRPAIPTQGCGRTGEKVIARRDVIGRLLPSGVQ